jgi:hypothetical protein
MSFQMQTETELPQQTDGIEILSRSKSSFENFLMQCLKCPEAKFRKWLHKVLIRAGFEIFEDGYVSDRAEKDARYKTVHNMLAIRGNKPNICLVAHTDVCRDHEALRESRFGFGGEYHHWMGSRHDNDDQHSSTKKSTEIVVDPVIKSWEDSKGKHRIIQDRNCKIQVGGDDRLGCAINTYIALNTGHSMGLLFTTDEESGLKSARVCDFPQFKDFELMAQVDRGNHSNEVVIKISGEPLCSYETAATLLEIAYDIGLPRAPVNGAHTDVYSMHQRGVIKDCVNMTCGYHNSHGADPTEYIDVQEAKDTMKYVSEIVKYYSLRNTASLDAATQVRVDTSSDSSTEEVVDEIADDEIITDEPENNQAVAEA